MVVPAAQTFLIENEWYWRIQEAGTSLTADAVVRDFLAPLLRLLRSHVDPADAMLHPDGRGIALQLGAHTSAIQVTANATDRIAVNHLVADVNRALATAELGHAFVLIVPRRYELRGALVSDDELTRLAGHPTLLVPSSRPSSRSIPTA